MRAVKKETLRLIETFVSQVPRPPSRPVSALPLPGCASVSLSLSLALALSLSRARSLSLATQGGSRGSAQQVTGTGTDAGRSKVAWPFLAGPAIQKSAPDYLDPPVPWRVTRAGVPPNAQSRSCQLSGGHSNQASKRACKVPPLHFRRGVLVHFACSLCNLQSEAPVRAKRTASQDTVPSNQWW